MQSCILLGASYVPLIASNLTYWATWHRSQHWGSIVEWRNLYTEKNYTGSIELEPRSLCRQHCHYCYKRAKPLRHLDLPFIYINKLKSIKKIHLPSYYVTKNQVRNFRRKRNFLRQTITNDSQTSTNRHVCTPSQFTKCWLTCLLASTSILIN